MAYSQYEQNSGYENQFGYENERMSGGQMNIRPLVDPEAEGEVNPDL